MSMHMVHHIAKGIATHGPVYSWWMFVYERMNSWICRRVTNRCHPEAKVMETYRIFDWCQYMKVTVQLSLNDSSKLCNKKAETEPKPQFQKSFHRIKDDPVTGKSLTWVTTGKEKTRTLSPLLLLTIPMVYTLERFSTFLATRLKIS